MYQTVVYHNPARSSGRQWQINARGSAAPTSHMYSSPSLFQIFLSRFAPLSPRSHSLLPSGPAWRARLRVGLGNAGPKPHGCSTGKDTSALHDALWNSGVHLLDCEVWTALVFFHLQLTSPKSRGKVKSWFLFPILLFSLTGCSFLLRAHCKVRVKAYSSQLVTFLGSVCCCLSLQLSHNTVF